MEDCGVERRHKIVRKHKQPNLRFSYLTPAKLVTEVTFGVYGLSLYSMGLEMEVQRYLKRETKWYRVCRNRSGQESWAY
jgi:hypothetical protein